MRRRVQHYGHRYDHGSRGVGGAPAPPLPGWAVDPAERLHPGPDGRVSRGRRVSVTLRTVLG